MEATPDDAAAGHAVYTERMLAIYDPAILGLLSRLVWRCPASRIQAHYDAHLSGDHLDIGVGTGYFLDHASYPVRAPRIALADLNENCLRTAARRLERFRPEVYRANVLEPIDLDIAPFASVGLNYLFHCLPGDIRAKGGAVFRSIAPLMEPGATVFGATLLHDGVRRNWVAKQIMRSNNRRGIFSNERDDLEGLQAVLGDHLAEPSVEVVGCVAVFAGRAH